MILENLGELIALIKKAGIFVMGAITPLVTSSVPHYSDAPAFPRSNIVWNIVLVKDVEQHFTLPIGAVIVIISKNKDIYGEKPVIKSGNVYSKVGAAGTTASIPTVNIVDGTGSCINTARYTLIPTDTTISFVADDNTKLSLAFYS